MIREPAVAGQFYSADASALAREVRDLVPQGGARRDARGILAPHAGYVYSGSVAGAVYGSVNLPKRFIILGPNHTGWGEALSLYPGGHWRTPIGPAVIDAGLTEALKKECPLVVPDRTAHRQEHSLEVQIPFLQVLAGDFSFAAIVVGTSDLRSLEELGHALARVAAAQSEPVLLVASSDMNHYEPADAGARKDRKAIERIEALDAAGLHRVVREHGISMCGFAPTVAALTACRDLGASEARLVRYANSGDVTGDHRSVVGYAGMMIL